MLLDRVGTAARTQEEKTANSVGSGYRRRMTVRGILSGFTVATAFFTRIPVVTPACRVAWLAAAAWAFPLVGAGIGGIAAFAFLLVQLLGLGDWPAAVLAVLAGIVLTGALHEDGLADTADGFGGGATREQKLDIMCDSRIGTYGVCALIVALFLRVGILASFFSAASVGWALLASHAGARASMMGLMYLVPPTRRDGLSSDAGQPPLESVAAAAVLGFLLAAICLGPLRTIVALILLVVVVMLMAWLSRKQIGGQTGDVLGAIEQVSEIVILLVALR